MSTLEIPEGGLELAGFHIDQPRGQPGNAGKWAKTPTEARALYPVNAASIGRGDNIHERFIRDNASNHDIVGFQRHQWQMYKMPDGRVIAFSPDENTKIEFDNEALADNVIDGYSQADTQYNDRWGVKPKDKLAAMRNSFKVTHPISHYRGTSYQYRPDDPKINGIDPFFAVLPDGTLFRGSTLDSVKRRSDNWQERRAEAVFHGRPQSATEPRQPPSGFTHVETFKGNDIYRSADGQTYRTINRAEDGPGVYRGSLISARAHIIQEQTGSRPIKATTGAPRPAFNTPAPAAPVKPPYKEPNWDGPLKRERNPNVAFDGPTLINGRKVLIRNPDGITSKQFQEIRPDFSVKQVVALVGPQEGATVTVRKGVSGGEPTAEVTISHKWYTSGRTIKKDSIYNASLFKTTEGLKHKSLGIEIVHDQVTEAVKLGGFKHLRLTAGGHGTGTHELQKKDDMTGYYIWPRCGYDAELEGPHAYHDELNARISKLKAVNVSDLMKDPVGRYLWQKHGQQMKMIFDLTPGSLSLKTMADYYVETHPKGAH